MLGISVSSQNDESRLSPTITPSLVRVTAGTDDKSVQLPPSSGLVRVTPDNFRGGAALGRALPHLDTHGVAVIRVFPNADDAYTPATMDFVATSDKYVGMLEQLYSWGVSDSDGTVDPA